MPISDAQRIERRRRDEIHDCVVPGCGTRAVEAFMVREYGRLAGRDWKPGEMIDLCGAHSHDVRQAEHLPHDQIAEWLRPDLKPDPTTVMDTLDGLL
ncbi:hypothetical protein [Streptosporangium sp. NPDC051022]|uniref:hypothetical protein n=1 Tax=Streptosporangium sp. NPDC051022 TaxID=3155752 RepID=UPI00342E7537